MRHDMRVTEPIAKPSRDDPVAAAVSEWIGGPYGAYGQRRRSAWWTPIRVAVAVGCLMLAAGFLLDTPCRDDGWATRSDPELWSSMCYSDVAFTYRESALASGGNVFGELLREHTVLVAAVIQGSAWLAQGLSGLAGGASDVVAEGVTFFDVTAVLVGLAALIVIIAAARIVPRRPWDAMLVALSPVLLLAATINWDLLGVALTSLALLAWTRGRPVTAGAILGLAASAALYPVLVLIGTLLIALRADERSAAMRSFTGTAGAAMLTWGLVNAPVALAFPDEWGAYFGSYAEAGIDIGSTWYALDLFIGENLALTGNVLLVFGAIVVAGLLIALIVLVPQPPRLAQVAFLLVAGYLLVAKSWAPQDALWLLPLAVLARPRWRDLLIWQAAEVVYFAAVWWFLEGVFTEGSGIWTDLYAIAVMIRVAGLLWIASRVIHDMFRPDLDPVRPYLSPAKPPVASETDLAAAQ